MKNVWKINILLIALSLQVGVMSCSGGDEEITSPPIITPIPEDTTMNESVKNDTVYYTFPEAYINWFAFNEMSTYYLWVKEIQSSMNNWKLNDDPQEKVRDIRYKENGVEVDKWTDVYDNISKHTGSDGGSVTTTYGYDFVFYWADEEMTHYAAVVTMTYPNSPAENAGLKRGSVILKVNGENITADNYKNLYQTTSATFSIADSRETINSPKDVTMNAVNMYEDPVLYERVFDCGGKKVGYFYFASFMDFSSCTRLMEVCKKFKDEGVKELILDLRYNGGGYTLVQDVLASMLAPQANVKNKDLYIIEHYNEEYSEALKKYYGDDYLNTYFKTEHKWTSNGKDYSFDTSDHNIGLDKIYALVSESSASASEALLIGLMPYMEIELIGTNTHGKYCGGYMLEADEWYQDLEDYYGEKAKEDPVNYKDFATTYPKFSGWRNYVADWGIYVMISTYTDKNGNNPCRPDGLTPNPDGKVEDEPRESYQLGDDREALLRVALTKAGKTDLTPLNEVSSRSVECALQKMDMHHASRMEGGRILLKPEKLRIPLSMPME